MSSSAKYSWMPFSSLGWARGRACSTSPFKSTQASRPTSWLSGSSSSPYRLPRAMCTSADESLAQSARQLACYMTKECAGMHCCSCLCCCACRHNSTENNDRRQTHQCLIGSWQATRPKCTRRMCRRVLLPVDACVAVHASRTDADEHDRLTNRS